MTKNSKKNNDSTVWHEPVEIKLNKDREFLDKEHPYKFMEEFYDVNERYNESNMEVREAIKRLLRLIKKDPDFLDPYLTLYDIYKDSGDYDQATEILDKAYNRALRLITDEKGIWPGMLPWAWLGNRHIIRTLLNKALALWDNGETESALDLLRKLLRTNPNDNIGARDYILAIRLNMSCKEFERRFDRGGYYDNTLTKWFETNHRKFPDEFDWWEKALEEYE
jgi:tetratricopeptide (TPR) repeat protein